MIEPYDTIFAGCSGISRSYSSSSSSSSSDSPESPRKLPVPEHPGLSLFSCFLNKAKPLSPPNINYNSYTNEELSEQVLYIKQLVNDPKWASDLKVFDEQFRNGVIDAIMEADKLHQNHTLFFQDVEIDRATGDTLCTARQFKAALLMVRDHFYGLMTIARTTEQEAGVSLILQTLLCGLEAIEKAPAPTSLFHFRLRELEGLTTPPEASHIPSGCSFLQHHLNNIINSDSMRDKVIAAVNQFVIDMVDRRNLFFELDDIVVKSAMNTEDPDSMPSALLQAYASALKRKPESIQNQFSAVLGSDFHSTLQAAFSNDTPGESGQLAPQALLQAVLQNSYARFNGSIDKLVPLDDREDLAVLGGCSISDIDDLMCGKLLEYFLILNQASSAEPMIILNKILSTHDPYPLHGFSRTGSLFKLGGEDGEHLSSLVSVGIGIIEDSFEHLEYREAMSSSVIFASAVAAQVFPSIYKVKEHDATITSISDVRLGWKAPLPFIDWLISQINPCYQADGRRREVAVPDVNSPRTRRRTSQEALKALRTTD